MVTMMCNCNFSSIKVVPGDKEGVVTDGAVEVDVDYQLQTNTLTVTFTGFESTSHGIMQHEIAVGTRPEYDDVLTYTSDGIISDDVEGIGKDSFFMGFVLF